MKKSFVTSLILFAVLLVCSPGFAADFNLKDFTSRYEKAVVYITTFDEKGRQIASGSGFFVNAAGDCVTNRHVIEGAVSATLETVDGSKYTLDKLLALKPDLDLVLVSINKPKMPMPYLEIAPGQPAKGERVVVFGNPLRVKFSVSEGIVSGIQKFPNPEWPQLTELKGTYVQFTAAISSGSSGGPVLNEAGQVIGVTTWGFVPRVSQNLNFAIPADAIRAVMNYNPDQPNSGLEQEEQARLSEKRRVAFVVMYGPKLMEQIKDKEKRDQITEVVEESIGAKFRPNKFAVKPTKDVMSQFETQWKVFNTTFKAPTMDDIDKPYLAYFGETQKYDVVVFAGIEIAQAKKISNLAVAASAVELEVDLRIMNVERKEYSYSRLLAGQGSDIFQKFWGWEAPNMVKPVVEALTYALRSFKREFSAEQIL